MERVSIGHAARPTSPWPLLAPENGPIGSAKQNLARRLQRRVPDENRPSPIHRVFCHCASTIGSHHRGDGTIDSAPKVVTPAAQVRPRFPRDPRLGSEVGGTPTAPIQHPSAMGAQGDKHACQSPAIHALELDDHSGSGSTLPRRAPLLNRVHAGRGPVDNP